MTGFFLFFNQSHTSGSFLVFFKHLELELLIIMLSAHFLGFFHWFWLGFFWPFFPPLAASRTSVRAGLIKLQEYFNCLGFRLSCFALKQFSWCFFPSFGGRSPNKCSYTFHLNLRCHCRKAEQRLLWHWNSINSRTKWGLWCSGKGTWSKQPRTVFLPVLIHYHGENSCTCVCMWGHHKNSPSFPKGNFFPSFLPLQLQQVSSLGLSLLVLIGFNISKLPSHLWWFSSQHQVV